MLSLRSPIGLGAALSASLAASLIAVAPAQAANDNDFAPSGNEWPGGVDGSSKPATNCQSSLFFGSTIFNGSFACFSGDKIYSSFFNSNPGDALNSAVFQFTETGADHTLAALGNFGPGLYSFGYTMTVFDALNSGQRLSSIDTFASAAVASGNAAVPGWAKTLTATTNDEARTVICTRAGSANPAACDGPKAFSVNVQPVSADFVSTLSVANLDNNVVTGFTDSVSQKLDDGETVPGPLPILGAAAAFGFSRKLRSRIKQSA